MQLDEIRNLTFISETLPVYFQLQAEKQFEAALRLIASGRQRHFEGARELRQATGLLCDSLRYRRLDIRPRLALAYAYSLLEEEDLALAALGEAEKLESTHPLLMEIAAELTGREIEACVRPQAWQIQAAEARELYDRLEKQIVSRLLRLMKYPHYQLEAAPTAERAQGFMTAMLEVETMCQEIRIRLSQLEPHLDVSPLRRRMQPLEVQLRRLQQKYRLCGEFRLLQQEMEASLKACQRLGGEFMRHAACGTLDFEIEVLLNDCDRFADRLDGLELRAPQQPELMQIYTVLLNLVAGLQERHARFAENRHLQAGNAA